MKKSLENKCYPWLQMKNMRSSVINRSNKSLSYFSIRLENLSKAPGNLTVDDLEDFCSLATHYASITPQSFRKVIPKNNKINISFVFSRNFIHVYIMKQIDLYLKRLIPFIKHYAYLFQFKNYFKQIN
jgi:hypothetical protein